MDMTREEIVARLELWKRLIDESVSSYDRESCEAYLAKYRQALADLDADTAKREGA